MINQKVNKNEIINSWRPLLEQAGVKDVNKIEWLSEYCHNFTLSEQINSLNENVHNMSHLNPNMNLSGRGDVMFPGNPGNMNSFGSQTPGSGDSTTQILATQIQVAAQTVGFDLVPVVPMRAPSGTLSYLDINYGGGRIKDAGGKDTVSSNLIISAEIESLTSGELEKGEIIYANSQGSEDAAYELTFLGRTRIEGYYMFRVRSYAGESGSYIQNGEGATEPIYDSIADGLSFYSDNGCTTARGEWASGPKNVDAFNNHISGFSGSSFEEENPYGSHSESEFPNINSHEPYSRGEGESTAYNMMDLTLFNKSVAAKTYKVAAHATQEQLEDLATEGIDVKAKLESALVNEITQSINKNILDRIRRNGATNAKQVYDREGLTFSTVFGRGATTTISSGFNLGPGVDSNTNIVLGNGDSIAVEDVSGGGESQGTLQRRIVGKLMAASNLINIRGRRGPATFAVVSGQMASVIQNISGFTPWSIDNTVSQRTGLYQIGQLAGISIYVDPTVDFSDNNITLGRKGNGEEPGLVFMPYKMADKVEVVPELTLGYKIGARSRYALVEAGFHPQTQYYTLSFKFLDGNAAI